MSHRDRRIYCKHRPRDNMDGNTLPMYHRQTSIIRVDIYTWWISTNVTVLKMPGCGKLYSIQTSLCTQYIIHTAHHKKQCSIHTAHCKQYSIQTAHWKQFTIHPTHCTLHCIVSKSHTADSIVKALHIVHYTILTLHTVHYTVSLPHTVNNKG